MPTTTPVKLSTIGYIILYVKDAQKTKTFYSETLGMKVKADDGGWVELETGATTLALHSDEKFQSNRPHGDPIVVFNVEDIYGVFEALKSKGIKFEQTEPQMVCEMGDKLGMSADFRDPDGNHLSIFGVVPRR